MGSAASVRETERVRNQLQRLYKSEGYRMTDFTTDGERGQVTLEWDKRSLPRCSGCKRAMRINRKSPQFVMDMPLGPVNCVLVRYDAVQG